MITNYHEFPDLLSDEIHRLIDDWARFLPGWVDTLDIYYDDNEVSSASSYASAGGNFNQRTASIWFHPKFWGLDIRSREITLFHEFGHILMVPVDQVVEMIIKSKPRKDISEKLYSEACEGFVNDFAILTWRIREFAHEDP